MPPKSRITRQMVLEAGIEVVRSRGIESLNVRSVAALLKCSTQPVMYHFSTMEELKQEIYANVDASHTQFIMNVDFEHEENPSLAIAKRYIQFAAEEPHLFRFLFQTDRFSNNNLIDMLGSDALAPLLQAMAEMVQITDEQIRDVFAATFFAVHGFASLLANNSIQYDPAYCDMILSNIFCGSIGVMKVGLDAMMEGPKE